MPTHKVNIGRLLGVKSLAALVNGLKGEIDKKRDDGRRVVIAASAGEVIDLHFYNSYPSNIANTLKASGTIETTTVQRADSIKARIFFDGPTNSRVEVSEGPSKSFAYIEELLISILGDKVSVETITVSPVMWFPRLQEIFEKNGGATLQSIKFSDYEPRAGVRIKANAKVEKDFTQDAFELFSENTVFLGCVCTFKTAMGKMKLTLSSTANFKYNCKEQVRATGELLVRKIALNEQIDFSTLPAPAKKDQAS